jgi:hypothetical protein
MGYKNNSDYPSILWDAFTNLFKLLFLLAFKEINTEKLVNLIVKNKENFFIKSGVFKIWINILRCFKD